MKRIYRAEAVPNEPEHEVRGGSASWDDDKRLHQVRGARPERQRQPHRRSADL